MRFHWDFKEGAVERQKNATPCFPFSTFVQINKGVIVFLTMTQLPPTLLWRVWRQYTPPPVGGVALFLKIITLITISAAGILIVCMRSPDRDDDNVRNIIRRICERCSDAGSFNYAAEL